MNSHEISLALSPFAKKGRMFAGKSGWRDNAEVFRSFTVSELRRAFSVYQTLNVCPLCLEPKSSCCLICDMWGMLAHGLILSDQYWGIASQPLFLGSQETGYEV